MKTLFEGIKQFAREEDAAAGVEYALLLAMVALVMAASYTTVSTAVSSIWTKIASDLSSAAG